MKGALSFWWLGLAGLLSCTRPLPEEGSPTAALYRERCGSCHRAYAPSVAKFPIWEMILPRMEANIARSGRVPLSTEERRVILDYLRRHSG